MVIQVEWRLFKMINASSSVAFSLFNKDDQVDERMEGRDDDSSYSVESPDITKMKRKDSEKDIVGREGFHNSQLSDRRGGEAGEAVGCTISVLRDELHPSTSVALEQPEPAEQQGGDLCLTQERQAKKEAGESREERAVSAFKMDVEGEDEEEEKLRQRALRVETIVSGTEVGQEPLHPEALAEKSQVPQNLLFVLCLQCTVHWPILYMHIKTVIKEYINVYSFKRLYKYFGCYSCILWIWHEICCPG